jgi:hypothetical protein
VSLTDNTLAPDALDRECSALAREGYGALVVAIRAEFERDRQRHEVAEVPTP